MSDWPEQAQSVVLCEGYYDRAFWNGWLTRLGCKDARPPGGGRVNDPWGLAVDRGQYAYRSGSGRFVRVVPCHGKEKVQRAARIYLAERASKTLSRLVINVDSDADTDTNSSTVTGIRSQDVHVLVRQFDVDAQLDDAGDISMDGNTTIASLVRWECVDAVASGIPGQQTLERLVCAAIVAAYPHRGQSVHGWLQSRQDPPQSCAKEFSWSYMAGWWADHGCEDFLRRLWDDAYVTAALEERLRASGAWRVAEALAA